MLSDHEALKSLSELFYKESQNTEAKIDVHSALNAIHRELYSRRNKSCPSLTKPNFDVQALTFEDIEQEEKDMLATLKKSLSEKIPVNVEEVLGVKAKPLFRCVKCHSQNVSYVLRQTRSADEGMTCIFTCQDCKHSYVDA